MIHRIRLYYSTTGSDAFHDWLTTWKADLDGDTADAVENNIPDASMSPRNNDLECYAVSMTFASHEDPLVVLEDPYGKLVECCEWSRAGYHACQHDEANPGDCTWKAENIPPDNGTVPDPVPAFT
jgi:hypothetical protein